MELSQLEYFCEVADSEHMTKSARKLHVAQPALSQSIHRLERELGVALFEREGRNIRLTAAGAQFRARVEPILSELDAAIRDAKGSAGGQVPVVRVGIFAASGLVVEAIADFMAEEPDVAFEVIQGDANAHFDVGVRTESPFRHRGAASMNEHVIGRFAEPIGVAVPVGRGYGNVIDLEALGQERFISLAGSRSFRHLCDELCAKRGFHPKIAFDSDSPGIVKKMIGLGLGVGFWPEFSWGSVETDQVTKRDRAEGVQWARIRDPEFVRVLSVERRDAKDEARQEAIVRFSGKLVERVESIFACTQQVPA